MDVLAIYLRLSLEDRKSGENKESFRGGMAGCGEDAQVCGGQESNSISNQRMLLHSYIEQDEELKHLVRQEFCDDGWSGSSMDRPGMNSLLEEVKKNQISCIIVKDLSRFSRDYIELGTYLNQILPFMGVRLIAVADHYDSREHSGNTIELDTAFKTLLYDLYSKDLSVKIKASFENKCASGEYVFGQVPLGYEKSRDRKNEVIVNEKEAAVVRGIFSMACQGKSCVEIARILHENGVPLARQMRNLKPMRGDGSYGTWSGKNVRRILKNRFYIGEMSYGKSVREYVGSRKGKKVREEYWKVIPCHHEPLVTQEEFERASCHGERHSMARKNDKHPLVGKLYCGGCGYAMVYKPARPYNKYRRFECCRHSVLKIPECCTYFSAEILEELVLSMINKELMLRGEAVRQAGGIAKFLKSGIDDAENTLKELCREKKRAEDSFGALYEKYAAGELTQDEYRTAADETENVKTALSKQARIYEEKLCQLKADQEKLGEDMRQAIRFSHMETLTQEMADIFIKKIYVYKDKRVEMEWNFKENVI